MSTSRNCRVCILVLVLVIGSALLSLIHMHLRMEETARKELMSTQASWAVLKPDSDEITNQRLSFGSQVSNSIDNNNNNGGNKAKRLPQVIIVGSRKCGTRALLRFLELNPAVKAAQNEVHFFDRIEQYRLGLGWYRSRMPDSSHDQLTIEKSPAYFVTPEVTERIQRMNSSIVLVLILRDPVVRLISDFSQLVANRLSDELHGAKQSHGEVSDLDTTLYDYATNGGSQEQTEGGSPSSNATLAWHEAENAFERFVLRPDGRVNDVRRAVRAGMYAIHLERWLSFFQLHQFRFVNGERLIQDPYEELHKLELSLGLEPFVRREHFVFNPRKRFYCLVQPNATTTVTGAEHVNQMKLRKVRTIGQQNERSMRCLSNHKGRKHVVVKEELITKLREFYRPYNEYLYSLTGVNFNWPQASTSQITL